MRFKNIIYAFVCVFVLVQCTDDFENINKNKKEAEEVHPKYVLSTIQSMIPDHIFKDDVNSNVVNLISQHLVKTNYENASYYDFRDDMHGGFTGYFYEIINQIRVIEDFAVELKNEPTLVDNANAWMMIAKTLRAISYQNMVDTQGPSVYSEALDLGNPTPKYNSESTIYIGLLEELSTAIDAVTNTDVELNLDGGAQDIIYNGNVLKWQKFANSILLRLSMRIADVDPENSKKYAEKAVNNNNGVISENAENALFPYKDKSPNGNRWFESTFKNNYHYAASSTVMNLHQRHAAAVDPRMKLMWRGGLDADEKFTKYEGQMPGIKSDKFQYAHTNPDMFGIGGEGKADYPYIFMDYSQVEYFLTEAKLRGYAIDGEVKMHFVSAVTANVNFLLQEIYPDDEAKATEVGEELAAYLALPEMDIDVVTDKLALIGVEKYLSLAYHGAEAWAELRRLDAPELTVPENAQSAHPLRLEFSKREVTVNEANVNEAIKMLSSGNNDVVTSLWWDIN
ncbi:MAG: SusD/RagB family nutrient-binding outer membrane lipoprotein [Marinilabiliaceae bacterium]|nr:SusD/RagB family nutrient-binding outer membrane lipoprotein [Marinilabiliaceae bacterium]